MASLVNRGWQAAKVIAKYAKEKEIKILFNPSLYLACKGKRFLGPVLQATTLLVLNEKEAHTLLGIKRKSPKKLCNMLRNLGPEMVIITRGKKGAVGSDGKNHYEIIPPKVRAVNTTGAGDAFASGFLGGFMNDQPFGKAMEIAQANASSVICKIGAKQGLLTYKQAQMFRKKHKICVKKA